MGQRIIGIDLGAHSLKVAEIDAGFQKTTLNRLAMIPLAPGPGTALERSLAALQEAIDAPESIDAVVVGIPGDRVLTRLLRIPITDAKKLPAVVGNELADDLPWEMEDIVYDFLPLGTPEGQVLTAAMKSLEIKELLGHLAALRLEPRSLLVASFSYASLIRRVDPTGTFVIIDLGHLRTNVSLIQNGRTLMGRTISRGGHQITEAFQQLFQLDYAEAELLKEQQALLVLGEKEGLDPRQKQLAMTTAQAVAPLVRDLRLSLGIIESQLHVRPERILLCGGTSCIQGLDTYLAVELGFPVESLQIDAAQQLQNEDLEREGTLRGALSLGLALSSGVRSQINLRQGEFAYRQDTSLFKDKLLTIAISVVLVLFFAAISSYMSLYALREEEEKLTQQLKKATQVVFGEPIINPKTVSKKVKLGSKAKSAGIGEKTAFDILDDLSRGIPGTDKVKLDISRLEIKSGKTYLTGTADSRSAVDDIIKALEKNKCFHKISTGKISDVSEGKKQFSLNIETTCF